jgi:hypothetical protein
MAPKPKKMILTYYIKRKIIIGFLMMLSFGQIPISKEINSHFAR